MDRKEASSQLAEFAARSRDKREQVTRRWQLAKQAVWFTLLAGAFLMYFLINIMVDAVYLFFASF